jgi:hypothetical protein
VSDCRVCKTELADDKSEICAGCRETLGVVEMPTARRPLGPCHKCNGTKLIRVIPRDHTLLTAGPYQTLSVTVPMRLTVVPTLATRWFHERADRPDPRMMRGLLEAYVCRTCGFTEWYCSDPQNIPIGPEFMTEEIDAGDGGPYR